IDRLLKLTNTQNGEKEVKLFSVIVHETDTGYAQCFSEDAYSQNMGLINLNEIIFSDEVRDDWSDSELWEKIKRFEKFSNPKEV
ncbi:MAG: 6-carboxytetrahydropterin synthase QueD, partial [Campylobacterota bacterium]